MDVKATRDVVDFLLNRVIALKASAVYHQRQYTESTVRLAAAENALLQAIGNEDNGKADAIRLLDVIDSFESNVQQSPSDTDSPQTLSPDKPVEH